MPVRKCNRLTQCRPRAEQRAMCCRLPWHQRRSRAAYSVIDGGGLLVGARQRRAAMWIAQPPRRISAASTKSWLRTWPPTGRGPLSTGQAGDCGERAGADHRVVAPVVAVRAVPPREPVRDQWAVEAAGELLQDARTGVVPFTITRQRLNEADAWGGAPSRPQAAPACRRSSGVSASSTTICA